METDEERKARWRSITIGGRKSGTRPANPNARNPIKQPTWEGTPVKDNRGLPYIHADGTPVTAKQFANNRAGYESQINNLKTRTTPLPQD